MTRRFPATPEFVRSARTLVYDLARAAGLGDDDAYDLALAVSEAAANAVIHSGAEWLEVSVHAEEGRITVLVRDDGVWRREVLETERYPGRGIAVILALTDELLVRRGTADHPGTEIWMTKSFV